MSDLFVERYRVIRQLGAGSMGVVFEAEDQLLNKHVAIKTMKKGVLGAEHIMRFQREATALAALNHPNLVPLYVFGITEDNGTIHGDERGNRSSTLRPHQRKTNHNQTSGLNIHPDLRCYAACARSIGLAQRPETRKHPGAKR